MSARFSFFLAFALLAIPLTKTQAQQSTNKGTVRLDGLSALVGGRAEDEFSSQPIYHSDVVLEATVRAVILKGESGWNASLHGMEYDRARRLAVLTRLLAKQAIQLGETISKESVARLLTQLEQRGGGAEKISSFLKANGLSENTLYSWLERSMLASTQLRALWDQLDPPTKKEITARVLSQSGATAATRDDALRAQARTELLDQAFLAQSLEWFQALFEVTHVRIFR